MSLSDLSTEGRAILYAIRGLRREIDTLSASNFPGDHPGPRKWIAIIKGLLNTAEARIADIQNKSSPNPIVSLQQASQATGYAYQCLTICQGVGLEEIPHPVVIPLQRLLNSLHLTNDFFFRAKLEANYELCPFDKRAFEGVRDPHQSLTDAITEIRWPFIRITVPSRAFSILPHFAIVGHEIGHAIFDKIDWRSVPNPVADKELLKRVARRIDDFRAKGGQVRYTAELIRDQTNSIFLNWLAEFASDAVGFFLMGPALFFAVGEFLLISWNLSGVSTSHPSNDLRLKFLHKKLVEGGSDSFAAIFKAAVGKELSVDINTGALPHNPSSEEVFRAAVNAIEGPFSIVQSAIIAELHRFMPQCADSIYAAAGAYLVSVSKGSLYTAEKYREDVANYLEPLLYAIPPIETTDRTGKRTNPADFASILNVGWILLLSSLDKMKLGGAETSTERRVEVLQGLILKGIELSEARRRWEAV